VAEFQAWRDLAEAGFPAFEASPGERPADWRTDAERTHDRNRAYMDATNGMDAMFPLSEREIQYRLQCARAYPTEAGFTTAVVNFGDWRDLADPERPC